MTRPTGMDFVDHILVTFHGRGYHQQCTASADLHPPPTSPFYLHMVWISPHDYCHSTLQLSTVEPTSPPKKLSTRSLLLAKGALRCKIRNVSTPRSLVALRYLLPLAILAYKVGCQIERLLSVFTRRLHRPHMLQRIAYQSERGYSNLPTMCLTLTPFSSASIPLPQSRWQRDPNSSKTSFLTQASPCRELRAASPSKDMGPSYLTLKTAKAQCIKSRSQTACASPTSSFVSSPRNIGHRRPTKACEEQGWKLTLMASFSSGATEIIDARFLTVVTQTLLFFAQLQPRQHIAPSPHTSKQWKPISTAKNMSSRSLDVVA